MPKRTARRERESAPSPNYDPTLENAFAGGGVHLVIVPIDYSENTRVLVDELRQRLPVARGN